MVLPCLEHLNFLKRITCHLFVETYFKFLCDLLTQKQRPKPIANFNVTYENETIEVVNSTKFLGIIIDKKLDWKTHINELCKKLSQSSYALYKLAPVLNVEALLLAYYGIVDTHLRYGVIFWGNSTDRELAFRAQKRCIRAMFNLKQYDSCRPYFRKYNILTLPSLYMLEIALFVKNNRNIFMRQSDRVVRNRRDDDIVTRARYKTALLKKSVICMAPLIYNKIPKEIRKNNINMFKKQFKTYLLEKCYYSVNEFLDIN